MSTPGLLSHSSPRVLSPSWHITMTQQARGSGRHQSRAVPTAVCFPVPRVTGKAAYEGCLGSRCTSHCFSLGRQRTQDRILLLNLAAPHLCKAPGCPRASCDQLRACAWNLKAKKFHHDFLKPFKQPSCSVFSPYIKITVF